MAVRDDMPDDPDHTVDSKRQLQQAVGLAETLGVELDDLHIAFIRLGEIGRGDHEEKTSII